MAVSESQTGCRLLIPLITFLVNAVFFYQQVWHYYLGIWLLALSMVYTLRLCGDWKRVGFVLLVLPGALVAARGSLSSAPATSLTKMATPRGEVLWLDPANASHIQNLMRAVAMFQSRLENHSDGIIFLERRLVTVSAPYHFFYLIPQTIRHTMIFPGWLRPRDFDGIERSIRRGNPVVLLQKADQGKPPADICRWNTYAFPKRFCQDLSGALLDPIPVDGSSWIFPSRFQ
jgi:hypothetical protein